MFGAPPFSIHHIFVAGHTVINLKLLAATFLLQKIGDRALETADHGFLVCEKIGDRAFVVLALAAFLRRFQFSTFRRFLSMVDATTAPAMRFCGAYEVAVIIISVNITVTSWDV